jgi:hypothetical protein
MLSWVQAAHWDNMSYADFREQSPEYQGMILAAWITTSRADAVKSWAERPKKKGKK